MPANCMGLDALALKAEFVSELEENPTLWLQELLPDFFPSPNAPHHDEHWQWVWAIKAGEPIESRVEILSRGHAKSTNAEGTCVAVGARSTRNYVLYLSETQDQADKHVGEVGTMIESENVAELYPYLAERKLGLYGNAKGWRRNRLATSTGFVIDAIGLDSAARGIKFEGKRPDLIIIDDVDGKHDSKIITEKKIEIITRSILPAMAPHGTVLFIQNKIHKDSIASQLIDGRADFMADRNEAIPIPAIWQMTYEKRENGIGHVITGGTPSWPAFGIDKCQALLDKIGLPAFLAECQHQVNENIEGALFEEWSEVHHLITESEYADGFKAMTHVDPTRQVDMCRDAQGNAIIPLNWSLGKGLDWGTTIKHPTVIAYVAQPYELHPLNDCVFAYREIVRPQWPVREDPPMPVSPKRIAELMEWAESPWNESSRMLCALMSHEASATFETFKHDLPDLHQQFAKWKPDRHGGVSAIQNLLQIDYTKPHPFRKHPITGEPIMGRPRIFFIVADGQGELYCDAEGKICVLPAIDSDGFVRARFEIPIYRNQQTQAGDEKNKPNKIDDDFIDAFKGVMGTFALKMTPITHEDLVEQLLPVASRREEIARMPLADNPAGALHLREFRKAKIEKALAPKNGFEHIYARRRNR